MSLFIYMSQGTFNFDALTPDFMWYALESIGIRAESGFLLSTVMKTAFISLPMKSVAAMW